MEIWKEVSTDKERKLKYLGPCNKCNKDTHQRLVMFTSCKYLYKCIKCKTINKQE